jgi:hypothetical protein
MNGTRLAISTVSLKLPAAYASTAESPVDKLDLMIGHLYTDIAVCCTVSGCRRTAKFSHERQG